MYICLGSWADIMEPYRTETNAPTFFYKLTLLLPAHQNPDVEFMSMQLVAYVLSFRDPG